MGDSRGRSDVELKGSLCLFREGLNGSHSCSGRILVELMWQENDGAYQWWLLT